MAEKMLKSRIILKHEPEQHWNLATGFTPFEGELIVYDADETHSQARLKVGDGQTNVKNLPFIADMDGTKQYVDDKIAELNSTVLKREIVETLPSLSLANTNTIYMVKDSSSQENNNVYLEYMLVQPSPKEYTNLEYMYTGTEEIKGTTITGEIAYISSTADMGDYFTFALYRTGSSSLSLYIKSDFLNIIHYNFAVGDQVKLVFDETQLLITQFSSVNIPYFELIGSSKCDLTTYQKKFGNVSGTTVTSTSSSLTFKTTSNNVEIGMPSSGTARIKANSNLQLYAPSITLRNYSGSGQININNVKTPTSTYQAANKTYVDSTVNTAKTTLNNNIQAALKETVEELDAHSQKNGTNIRLDNVNPITHTLNLSFLGNNLLPYPYPQTTMTQDGITVTDRGDGSLLVNGTGTGHNSITFPLTTNWTLEPGTYYLDVVCEGTIDFGGATYKNNPIVYLNGITESGENRSLYPGSTNTFTEKFNITTAYVIIYTSDHSSIYFSYDNVIVKPQLVLGNAPKDWTPPGVINNLSDTTITVCGKNLIPPTRADSSSTTYTGLTFINNNDGSISVNGSNPDYSAYYWFIPQNSLYLPSGTYTFSTGISGSSSTYYAGFKYGDQEIYSYSSPSTFTLTEPTLCGCCFCAAKGQTLNNVTIYPQVELGSTITTYEIPVVPQVANTSHSSFKSIYPTTTVFSNNEDMTISCSYYKNVEGSTNNIIKEYIDNQVITWETF